MNSDVSEKLRRDHNVNDFDSGHPQLDQYLAQHAYQSQLSNASQTYVATDADRIVGYYTLVVGHVAYDDAPARLKKGLARHPVPLMTLARLAVSRNSQGKGIGAALLKDAMLRTLHAAEIAGIRALQVHAKDASARNFYLHFTFDPSPTDPLHLFLLVKEMRALLR